MFNNQISIDSANLYHTLKSAFNHATIDENAIRKLISGKPNVLIDEDLEERFDQLISKQLPEAFGRFISGLDLQNSFRHLGRYVRSFADAEFVIKNMESSILSQMEKFSITEPCKWIDDLNACCTELSIIYSLPGN